MPLKKKPNEWFDQQPDEEYEAYITRINHSERYDLKFRLIDSSLNEPQSYKQVNSGSHGWINGGNGHSPKFTKKTRNALGGIDEPSRPRTARSKFEKRILRQVSTTLVRKTRLTTGPVRVARTFDLV
jgi:hypothetical protein